MKNKYLRLILKKNRTIQDSLDLMEYWNSISGQELKYALHLAEMLKKVVPTYEDMSVADFDISPDGDFNRA